MFKIVKKSKPQSWTYENPIGTIPRMQVDFYYDVVCPYAYLASTRIDGLAKRTGATVRWRPVLLGGLFRHAQGTQNPGGQMSAPRAHLNRLDMSRWADLWDVPLTMPAAHPRRSVEAMRLLIGTPDVQRPALSRALFRAYWAEGLDITDLAVLGDIANTHGVNPDVIHDPKVRQGLFDSTAEAAGVGAFGVPTFRVGDQIFWGQDRIHLVEAALGHRSGSTAGQGRSGGKLTFFHDFASPFSYLAATQIETFAATHGATISWRPILLGGLFRAIGTPDVPLLQMHAAKQRYIQRDLQDWAQWWGVDFRFPSRFPIRTVTALRAALVEPAATLPIYRAIWVDDRAVDDERVLAAVLDDAGFDARDILAQIKSPAIKAVLRANTEAAEAAGGCGVPTFVVDQPAGPLLFWGQDRFDHVAAALAGWRPGCG